MASERGSTILESVFAIALVMATAVGAIQVALLLYARNVVQASAHEAARAALERGVSDEEARIVAMRMASTSIGKMARDVAVELDQRRVGRRDIVTVRVAASLVPTGPLPVSVEARGVATVGTAAEPR